MTTKNSTLVANFETSPTAYNATQELHGRIRVAQGSIELATGDLDDDDIVMLAPIPKGASIKSIKLASDDLDTGTALAWNVGVYETDGTVVDEDAYATAITLGQAATGYTEYRFEAAGIETTGQRVWEDASVSSDPGGGHYYLAATVSTAAGTPAAGTLAFQIEYVMD